MTIQGSLHPMPLLVAAGLAPCIEPSCLDTWARGAAGGAHGGKNCFQASGCGMMSKEGPAWSTHGRKAYLGGCEHAYIHD